MSTFGISTSGSKDLVRHRHCLGPHIYNDEIDVHEAEEEKYKLAYKYIGYIDIPEDSIRRPIYYISIYI
jgi:hypothetical protein